MAVQTGWMLIHARSVEIIGSAALTCPFGQRLKESRSLRDAHVQILLLSLGPHVAPCITTSSHLRWPSSVDVSCWIARLRFQEYRSDTCPSTIDHQPCRALGRVLQTTSLGNPPAHNCVTIIFRLWKNRSSRTDQSLDYLSTMAHYHDPSSHPESNRNHLPSLEEVLQRRTLAPVDLFSFYIYMRDQQRSVDYLDFW